MSREITASDLLDLPHFVILRNEKHTIVQDYSNGKDAHVAATRLAMEDVPGEVIVAVRVRTLSSIQFVNRHKRN
jgi:hypothetical protein